MAAPREERYCRSTRMTADRIFWASTVMSRRSKSPAQLEHLPQRSGASSPKYRRR